MSGNIFPLPFSTHLVFVAVAFVFFLIQFIRVRYKYQLVMAVAVAVTMLIYVKDSKMWFYSVGLIEFGLLLIALVAAIVEKKSRKELAEGTDISQKEEIKAAAEETEGEE